MYIAVQPQWKTYWFPFSMAFLRGNWAEWKYLSPHETMGISYYPNEEVRKINGNVPGDFVSRTAIMKDPAYFLPFAWRRKMF